MRVRQGNDFIFLWAIERNGEPEDFSNAVNIRLHFKNFDYVGEVKSFQIVDGNIVRVEVSPEWASRLGAYRLILSYEFENQSYSDGDQKCVVDVLAFTIVSKTSEADDVKEMAKTTDIMIGLKGLSAYEVWLKDNPGKTKEDYYNWLRQPATDAAASIGELEQTIEGNEALRVTAEQGRSDAELLRVGAEGIRNANEIDRINAEGIRDANETDRINAESDRADAEELRDQAEVAREEAEGLRQTNTNTAIQNANNAATAANTAAGLANNAATAANTAAGNANNAAEAANTAAGLADTARTELTTAVNTKLDEADGKIEEMDETLSTYDGRVTQVESDIDQLAGEVSLFKEESNLKDAIQNSKIKDIESIISTMNPNQSAQLSVSGVSPLSLPKNAANGGMSVKLEGLTAENLVVNGDFNSSSGWRGNNWIVENGVASNSGRVGIFYQYKGTPIINTNIYYIAFLTVSDTADLSMNNSSGGIMFSGTARKVYSTGYSSIRLTAVANGYLGIVGGYDSNQPVIDKLRVINLTETFGAGNEPTKEQCDLMFSDYFEGVKSFEPTGRVRSVDKNGLNPTALYLTAPELRSNGLVKDEIRKGANGYEHVKRVGVGTSNGEIVTDGGFSDPTKWTLSGTAIISNGTLKLNAEAGTASTATQNKTITAGRIYRYKMDVLSITGVAFLFLGNAVARVITSADLGKTISGFFLMPTGGNRIQLAKELSLNVSAEFDNLSIFEYNPTEGVAIAGGEAVYGGNIHYTLATPVITPISYGGILNSAENGTVYHEPIIADAGVYSDRMDILLTDYPIATIEEIIKHENGVDTYLNVASAVIASDGLSFTHPDLADGDLVLFTYAFDKESTNGNITATFYDSNVVKIDTVTGKAYKIEDVVTNGVLTRTLTEV